MATQIGGIGDVRFSILDEALFQQQFGSQWILADGRSIAGSALASLAGITNSPDLRGEFIRGADAGRGVAPDQYQNITYTANTSTNLITLSGAPSLSELAVTTGQIVVLNSSLTVPSPLVAGTRYFAIAFSSTTFKVATSLSNAIAGIFVSLSTNGTGTQTATMSRVSGSFQSHQLAGHSHSVPQSYTDIYSGIANLSAPATPQTTNNPTTPWTLGTTGGNETRPRHIAMYAYIRIN